MILPAPYYDTPRGQVAIILLAALRGLYIDEGRRTVTKREAIRFITQRHWFALEKEDFEPYPSQRFLTAEPRWHTLVAWARKDSVLRDLVSYEERDAWGLTRFGRDAIDREQAQCQKGIHPVRCCFLWTWEFKQFMCPTHQPGRGDCRRPLHFYRDLISEAALHEIKREAEEILRILCP